MYAQTIRKKMLNEIDRMMPDIDLKLPKDRPNSKRIAGIVATTAGLFGVVAAGIVIYNVAAQDNKPQGEKPATIGVYYQGQTVTDFENRSITLLSCDFQNETKVVLSVSLNADHYCVQESSKAVACYQGGNYEELRFDNAAFSTLNPGLDCAAYADYSGEIFIPFCVDSDGRSLLDDKLVYLSYSFGFHADKDNSGSEFHVAGKEKR